MADERLLPPGIRDDRSLGMLELIDRLGTLDLTVLLIYRIDSVLADALPLLAWQFDVLGVKGWDLSATEAQRRELVGRAVELHRRRGTPWAIRTVLEAAGFPGVMIEEHSGHWAEFIVHVRALDEASSPSDQERTLIPALVEAYKNARSHLDSLRYGTAGVSDAVAQPTDLPMPINVNTVFLHDGLHLRDGTVLHQHISTEAVSAD